VKLHSLLLPLFAAVLLSFCQWAEAQQPTQLRVVAFNIQIGIGMDKQTNLERTAAAIKALNPDLVALQEVDRKARRSQGVDQALELARMTGMHVVFGKASVREGIDQDGGDYGNAILSRYPIKRSQNRPLPNTRGYELRGVLEVEVDVPVASGKRVPVRFFSAHFDNASEPDRIAAAKLLNELAMANPNIPTIFGADLNALPESEPVRILKERWSFAGSLDEPSYPASDPKRRIDYIMFRPEGAWKLVEANVASEPMASDHRPVFAVFEYAR